MASNMNKRKRSDDREHEPPSTGILSRTCHCVSERCSEGQCTIFSDFPVDLRNRLFSAIMTSFLDTGPPLHFLGIGPVSITTLSIDNCNGEEPYAFCDAYCSVSRQEKRYLLAELFEMGIDILINYVKSEEIPRSKKERIVLSKLLHFLKNSEEKGETDPLQNLDKLEDQTEINIVLANHLFGKLSSTPDFLMDIQGKQKGDSCPCLSPMCKVTGSFGDTSVGNDQVWHGNLDIIVKNDLAIQSPKEAESQGVKSPVEVKKGGKCLQKNPQLIAETIVFSFLQKQKHPESNHYMFPCIGILDTEMVFYFYDSEHDVLLESNRISLLTPDSNISIVAVVSAWLVVNYRFLCSGLADILKPEKASFFSKVKSKLSVYQNQLRLGKVRSAEQRFEKTNKFPLIIGPVADRLKEKVDL
ncbi:uncharacterized protein [Argopecten irradians]|uniref:uncharacterized protein n=1 Tax=Argopecten irradians TaxID=31199 RepID=UPI0037192B43